ncbi:MAG: PPK2 family polyphosphate kinase [Robiginitomaculum sp.]
MSAFAKPFLIAPNSVIDVTKVATANTALFKNKKAARKSIKQDGKAIAPLAHKLYAEHKRSLLIVLQGMDTSGKDGTTAAILRHTPPLNTYVKAFKAPSKIELSHDYLWRVHAASPSAGQIGVFNRSHYEDVLVVKVRKFASESAIESRYAQINDFEKLLSENGVTVLKFMLHISPQVQEERLRDRLINPDKRWKFNPGDLADRKLWPKFMGAYSDMVSRCSSAHAPWHIIPSDSRAVRGAIITRIVRETLEGMNLAYPDPGYRPGDYNVSDYKI